VSQSRLALAKHGRWFDMSTLKVNTLEEATVGGATFYTAKAWVNFIGGGTVTIRDSGNVSSITDNGTGEYYANFSSAMSDVNYSFALGTYLAGSATPAPFALALSTAQTRLWVRASSTNVGYDTSTYCVSIIR
jgi:hypothetical protein